MEADVFQDLQPASWRPWRVNGVVPVPKFVDMRCRKSQCFSSSPKVEKNQMSQLERSYAGGTPPSCGRVSLLSLFTLSTDWMRPVDFIGPTPIREGILP